MAPTSLITSNQVDQGEGSVMYSWETVSHVAGVISSLLREYGVYTLLLIWTSLITYKVFKHKEKIRLEKECSRKKEIEQEKARAKERKRNVDYWNQRWQREHCQYRPNDKKMEDDILRMLDIPEKN